MNLPNPILYFSDFVDTEPLSLMSLNGLSKSSSFKEMAKSQGKLKKFMEIKNLDVFIGQKETSKNPKSLRRSEEIN